MSSALEPLLRACKPKWSEFIPDHIKPTPKQLAYMMLPHREALYGGAAGSGKSVVLAAIALEYTDITEYRGIIFRRTLTEAKLGNSITDLLLQWLGERGDVFFDSHYNTFHFPSGAQLSIGYIKNELDHERYKGTSFHTVEFDECTDFPENQYLFLNRSVRRTKDSIIPTRVRAATNPGGIGHLHIKKRFKIYKDPDGRWRGHHPHRPFIQALLTDNPHIDQESYTLSLNEMGFLDRKRMKDGDWSASEGARFQESWFEHRWRIRGAYFNAPSLGKSWHRSACEIFFTLDPAASEREGVANVVFRQSRAPSYSVCSVWARTPDNYLLMLDQIRIQCEIPDLVQVVVKTAQVYRPGRIVIEGNGVGKGVYQILEFMGLPIYPVTTSTDKVANSSAAQTRAERGKIILPDDAPWLEIFLGEVLVWTGHLFDIADQIDSLSNAAIYVQSVAGFGERLYESQDFSIPETIGDGWTNGIY